MPVKVESVLITGGLGQLGYNIYSELKDYYKICIIDDQSNSKYAPPEDVIFVSEDIVSDTAYNQLPKIDYIVHCAAQISINKSVNDPMFDAKTNILGTIKLLEYAKKAEIKKFVHISSAATYGHPEFSPITENHPRNPLSPYGLSKLTSQNYVILFSDLFNLDCVVVVPFNIFSPLQNENDPYAGVIFKFISAVKEDKSPSIEGDGQQTRDFIHVKDVASAIKLILEKDTQGEKIFNIGSGIPTKILELANKVIEISGKDLAIEYKEARIGDIKDSYCSIEKATKILGFKPSITLDEGLREIFDS